MKIVYKDNIDQKKEDYQQLCIEELRRLDAFPSSVWKPVGSDMIAISGNHSNPESFAGCGIIQTVLYEHAYFGACCELNRGLYLNLTDNDGTWKGVYNILSSIERIEID